MGGGKSRALCEDVFQDALDFPGILLPIIRQSHVSLAMTTKRTMLTQVIPPELLAHCQMKASGGEDFIKLPNGSIIYFAGLDDPIRWFSSEIGGVAFDEAHEIPEDSVVKMISRLRQAGMPGKITLGFNPENPGHWLHRWFIAGAEKTDTGYWKDELWALDASSPYGSAEFIFAKATDNPYLPEDYVLQNLGGMPELLRKRYLEGEWLFTHGTQFFDIEALLHYEKLCPRPLRRIDFERQGYGNTARIKETRDGRIRVYAEPVKGNRYAIGADVATGRGKDYSAAYVVDLQDMAFVAEFHRKIDPDLFAEQLHFLGRWYNTALIAVESAGGFGEPVIISLRDGKGGRPAYPKLYRHQLDSNVNLDVTQRYGYPMSSKTRPLVLNAMEKAIRERDLPFLSDLLYGECVTFVRADTTPSPRAQESCNDDCVLAAAITLEMYRKHGRHIPREKRLEGRKKRERRGRSWQELLKGGGEAAFDHKRYRPEGASA